MGILGLFSKVPRKAAQYAVRIETLGSLIFSRCNLPEKNNLLRLTNFFAEPTKIEHVCLNMKYLQ